MSKKTAITVKVAKANKSNGLLALAPEEQRDDVLMELRMPQSEQRSSEIKTNLAVHKSCCDW